MPVVSKNNQKFLKNWEITRKKGRLLYALTEGSIFGFIIALFTFLADLFNLTGETLDMNRFLYFMYAVILGIIGYYLLFWPLNEYYYRKIKNQQQDLNEKHP